MNLFEAELVEIVAKSSFVWERLDPECFLIDTAHLNQQEIGHRLDRWCQVVAQGNWKRFQERLQYDGLDINSASVLLGNVQVAKGQSLPDWVRTLQQIMQTALDFDPVNILFLPTEPQEPLPFEDILLPAILVARQKLLNRLESPHFSLDYLPFSILSEKAYYSLERNLLEQLTKICAKTLYFEFSQVRPFGSSLVNLLLRETEDIGSNIYYKKFTNQLLQDGLLAFFKKYPVLGRLISTRLDFWVESVANFLLRLADDIEEIKQTFGSKSAIETSKRDRLSTHFEKVVELETSLSDSHNQGNTVIALTFLSGLKLIYKPKNLGLELAFLQFLDWCNCHGKLLEFKIIRILNRQSYGWMEYVKHRPCTSEVAAQKFYRRAGMLLCLLYVLKGTDCHRENLIASGEHLVLVDMETILHHEANLIKNSSFIQEFETIAEKQFLDSVLCTGLLPCWHFSPDKRVASDISGLGSVDSQQALVKATRWQCVNADNMHLRDEAVVLSPQKNIPFLREVALSPNDYQDHVIGGFEQMYHFLLAQQEFLLAPEGPLFAMQHQQVRFIFRATRVYSVILQATLTPDFLKDGVDFSIELDLLSRAFLLAQSKPDDWPVLSSELRAMEQLDIPYFSANASSDTLSLKINQDIPHYFKDSSYQKVLNQLQTLNENDLAQQIALIHGAFYAKVTRAPTSEQWKWKPEPEPLFTSEQFIQEAKEIAAEIGLRAIQEVDGSVNWIGFGYVPNADRFQLQVLGENLYDGRCGIALFLAALAQVIGDQQFRVLALRALQSVRKQIQTFDYESGQLFARSMGIGGAEGLGSIIYAFVKVSQFLEDDTLLTDAQVLANWITPDLVAVDKQFDVIGGAAGAILGLLSLYTATNESTILEKAITCGHHLLKHRTTYESSPKAWKTLGEKPLTGFAHGAAGIAYALLRLYAFTQELEYLEAALEGIEYERTVFSESAGNWPDYRESKQQKGQTNFMVNWCSGAPGVGLGRLGSLEIVKMPEIEQEIEIALKTTQKYGLQARDSLCCGNLGRSEALLVGARRLTRPDWHQVALQQATNVVTRSKRTSSYQLLPTLPHLVFNPGFFQGTSGVGYQLLRLAVNILPSVLLWE